MTKGIVSFVFTDRFDELKSFFTKALGVEGQSGGPSWFSFQLGDSLFALHRASATAPADKLFHMDFLVEDIASSLDGFRKAGAKVVRDVQDEAFGKSAVVEDLEGRQYMLVQHGE